jgi:heme-degrading monooxygenase HmoA
VIARVWRARTATREAAEAYTRYLEEHIFGRLRAIPGYRGAAVLRRQDDRGFEFVVETRWASRDAVRAFAGADEEAAVVTPEARALLSEHDSRTRHYEVVAEHRAEPG